MNDAKEKFSSVEHIDNLIYLLNNYKISSSVFGKDYGLMELLRGNLIASLNTAKSIYARRLDLDDNVFWVNYLKEVSFDQGNEERAKKSILALYIIPEMMVDQIRIDGTESSAMKEVEEFKKESFSEVEAESLTLYNFFENRYHAIWKFSILESKLRGAFEQIDSDAINKKFENIKNDKEEFEIGWQRAKEKMNNDIEASNELLAELNDNTSFAALYKGFDTYACEIKARLKRSNVEKWSLVISLCVVFASAVVLKYVFEPDLIVFISFLGAFGVAGALLKVCLKKIDQLEQILSKVEHKLAVSAFYEFRSKQIENKEEREAAYQDYYKFIFTKMETTEWNAPDMAENIASIISALKK